ncbi:von Willebrand factor type A domain-containing protein [Xylaria acuta]|nr:von Willebrand factor type A domain-containing protein [Xylaria acuta]
MVRTNMPPRGTHNLTQPLCGCWYPMPRPNTTHHIQRSYLPLHGMKVHAVIKDVASRTVLTQTFSNETNGHLKGMVYSFPLYDGVSIVSFAATIGDVQIRGVVKEKQQARREYHDAVNKGSSAGLLEQLPEASDVFVASIGNVPAKTQVIVEVVYIGELKHDAESNGIRFTIPTAIAPRYGTTPDDILTAQILHKTADNIQVAVDFQSPEGCHIQQIQSPSHPITVSVGRTTDMPSTAYISNRGSATLSLDTTSLDKDFVIIASIKDADIPKALLETHATIPNQRALMTTLVPRFSIAPTYGEIVFIVDRSGSMDGKMEMVIKAMTILLKSLTSGTKFNILSFGSHHSFLWPRSKSYNDASLSEALSHIGAFEADFGGTEMYQPVQDTISQRYSDMLLDAIILTDGEIWNQDSLFDLIRKAATDYKCRFFSLGIGSGASTALVEGIATAGNGFSQFVVEGERIDAKMVRLLKGALTPHIDDYSLEVKYKQEDEDFEIIETMKALRVDIISPTASTGESAPKPPISFFDHKLDTDHDGAASPASTKAKGNKFAHLPIISPPSVLQAPCRVPPLYSFSRTTVYLLLDPSTSHRTPHAVILRATCSQGPLELEIKVEDIGKGETIHQLAAKKAVSEIEKNGGWLASATDKVGGTLIKNKYDGRWGELVEREAVRLGEKYQIAGKWCSFVAVEGDIEHEAIVFGGKEVPPPSRARLQRASAPQAMLSPYSPPQSYHRSAALTMSLPSSSQVVPAPGARKMALSTRANRFMSCPGSSRRRSTESPKADNHDDKMYEVISLQKSDGSWECDQRLLDIVGISLDSERRNTIVATALAIAFLQVRMAHEAESWELIVEKAKSWLGQKHGVDADKEISDAQRLL